MRDQPPSKPTPPAYTWFSNVQLEGLRDFWSVYQACFEEMQAALIAPLEAHPTFGPLIANMPESQRAAQNAESRRILARAIEEGDWSEYEAQLRGQGGVYGAMGITFDDWYDVIRLFGRYLRPRIRERYQDEAERLARALDAMQEFIDRVMGVIGSSYIDSKEAALRSSERRLATTLMSIGDGVVTTDAAGLVERMNPVAEGLTGWKLGEAKGKPLREILRVANSADAGATNPLEDPLRRGAADAAFELAVTDRAGAAHPVSASVAPIASSPGDLQGAVIVLRDISAAKAAVEERERAAAALRRSEETLSATLAALHEGVAIYDSNGAIVYQNPAAMRLFPPSDSAPAPYDLLAVDGTTPLSRDETPLRRALRGEEVERTEFMVRGGNHPAGLVLSASSSVIRNKDGVSFGAVTTFHDITHQKQVAAQEKRAAELELRQKQAEEASRLKSEFLANMSHELRTPLNAIIGFAELLHDGRVGPVEPRQQEFLEDILTSGRHLLQLINDILDLSKVEAGKMDFFPEEVDVRRVFSEVVSILRSTAAAKRIAVDVTVEPEIAKVTIDAARLKQVLYNYLSNALKFTPEGGAVKVIAACESDDSWQLRVEDNGVGIAPADLDRLFVEFQQLESGITKSHGGTGLGLALTKRLVEAQGGSVGVESELGAGSRFHAVLPRQWDGVVTPPRLDVTSPADRGAPVILVVDDDPNDRQTIEAALVEAGYRVESAATGARAIEMLAERRYDAVTLDIILPDMTGLDVLASLRSNDKHPDVPVIVITVVKEHAAAGFVVSGVLPKPIDANELLSILGRAGVPPRPGACVMVIDDDAASLKLMAATLDALHYRPRCYATAELALAAIPHDAPQAVIVDLMMPGMDGFEFLTRFRGMREHRDVPVLVWTVKDLTQSELARIHASAASVVAKGKGASDLLATIGAHLSRSTHRAETEHGR
jgi:PAS domain S-box-containing protein